MAEFELFYHVCFAQFKPHHGYKINNHDVHHDVGDNKHRYYLAMTLLSP